MLRAVVFSLLALLLTGCDTGFRQMAATEYGLIFRRLPTFLGGGLSSKAVSPGEYVLIWPWDSLYRYDASVRYISWGGQPDRDSGREKEYVHTRSLDGNEVALAVTIQYRINPDTEKLRYLARYVATNDEGVYELVQAIGRADLRTYMNELKTSAFFDRNSRYTAIDKVRDAMNKRLNDYGVIVEKVILDEHRFERLLGDGTIDRSYQEKIDETQKLGQDTERELLRIDTIRAKKAQELNETQARVNRVVAEAEGYSKQATVRGNAYFESKRNEAEGILATGKGEVEGLAEKIKALSGPGGRAMLKLEFAKYLGREKPSFVVLGQGAGDRDIGVRRTDTNQLLDQLGLMEGNRERERKAEPILPESILKKE